MTAIDQDPRWRTIQNRENGAFYYSVRSTGIYCRPSCPARLPLPENVRFHNTAEEAEQGGFRPCQRCRPDLPSLQERQALLVATACREIEQAEAPLSLSDLADRLGLSPSHLHRLFKEYTGLTPKAYSAAHRARQVREQLRAGGSVTEAVYGAGFGSSSRFYEQSRRILGMTPGQYRAGGQGTVIRFAVGRCSLGEILVASSEQGLCAILLGNDPEFLVRDLQDRFPQAQLVGGQADFEALVAEVVGFVECPARGLQLPLDVRGTAFQRRVWQALCDIPAGTTATYSQVARSIGRPTAVRAVAGACAANALAVAIPCHRVVRRDGDLSGYRWGVERKRRLLQVESGTLLEGQQGLVEGL
jgi:AraC family transcriptional regulator of adaptative response/methylated-DNA-[protein]-cysteine methyltransferase